MTNVNMPKCIHFFFCFRLFIYLFRRDKVQQISSVSELLQRCIFYFGYIFIYIYIYIYYIYIYSKIQIKYLLCEYIIMKIFYPKC